MDVRLKHVVAVARTGSFTAAASEIGVTQSAVTRAVADLEREIGYSIFYRSVRGSVLTDRGRDFADRARRLLEDERTLLKGDFDSSDPYAGTLRIGVSPALMESLLIEPLANLKAQHAHLHLEVVSGPFERIVPMLHNGGVDVIVGLDNAFTQWPEFQRHPLWELKASLFVRKGHPLLSDGKITWAKVAQYEIIAGSYSQPYGAEVRTLYEQEGIDWRKRLHIIDYFPLLARIVEKSDVLGVVTTAYSATRKFQASFHMLDRLSIFSPVNLCCATRLRWEDGPILRTFIQAMRDFGDPVHRPPY